MSACHPLRAVTPKMSGLEGMAFRSEAGSMELEHLLLLEQMAIV